MCSWEGQGVCPCSMDSLAPILGYLSPPLPPLPAPAPQPPSTSTRSPPPKNTFSSDWDPGRGGWAALVRGGECRPSCLCCRAEDAARIRSEAVDDSGLLTPCEASLSPCASTDCGHSCFSSGSQVMRGRSETHKNKMLKKRIIPNRESGIRVLFPSRLA